MKARRKKTLGLADQVRVLRHSAKNAFKSDGCTAVPDLNFGADCCRAHDVCYATGCMSRAEADRNLRRCIAAKGYIILPWIYWLGVRIFGRKYYHGNT